MATYTVLHGDTLNSIAAKNGTTALALYAANASAIGEFTTRPQPGLSLTLPAATKKKAPTPGKETPPAAPWVAGDVGMANPMTAPGDLIKGGTAGAPEALPVTFTNMLLMTAGYPVAPAWASIITLIHAAPTNQTTLLAFDDTPSTGGLYAFDLNTGWVKIGLATS